ncbi:hypothetical protein MG293_018018 [Ovis ammon polii]|uniref:tryptase n=1 Tax=Ovis ammon polii TaxID=230172 RepID=A0AAD4Y1B8_OVIAM|nr:hypothetical protein MG293_018018 [Ovis ammon polii]KAI4551345.1 hypothetical protein MJT46_017597 [Ovis ammon polii x Ovis aries]
MVVPATPPTLRAPCLGVLASLLILAAPATLDAVKTAGPPACGKRLQLNRIVGGEDSSDAEWPWVVSIRKNGTHHCAGSLLTSRWVLTAAHCFKEYVRSARPSTHNLDKPTQFSVLLGAWQLGNPGPRSQEVGIAWAQPHPVYSWKEGSRADIALVHLEHAIQFSERVLPICLPDSTVQLSPDTDCWIAGWGSVQDGVPLPHPQTLQKLKVPIIDSATCGRLYWRGAGQGAITEDMLCAGYLEGERDACLDVYDYLPYYLVHLFFTIPSPAHTTRRVIPVRADAGNALNRVLSVDSSERLLAAIRGGDKELAMRTSKPDEGP